MTTTNFPTGSRAWFLHDSGAFGYEYAAVRVISTGPTGKFVTVQTRSRLGDRRFRTSPANLRPVTGQAPEWNEDWTR